MSFDQKNPSLLQQTQTSHTLGTACDPYSGQGIEREMDVVVLTQKTANPTAAPDQTSFAYISNDTSTPGTCTYAIVNPNTNTPMALIKKDACDRDMQTYLNLHDAPGGGYIWKAHMQPLN